MDCTHPDDQLHSDGKEIWCDLCEQILDEVEIANWKPQASQLRSFAASELA